MYVQQRKIVTRIALKRRSRMKSSRRNPSLGHRRRTSQSQTMELHQMGMLEHSLHQVESSTPRSLPLVRVMHREREVNPILKVISVVWNSNCRIRLRWCSHRLRSFRIRLSSICTVGVSFWFYVFWFLTTLFLSSWYRDRLSVDWRSCQRSHGMESLKKWKSYFWIRCLLVRLGHWLG